MCAPVRLLADFDTPHPTSYDTMQRSARNKSMPSSAAIADEPVALVYQDGCTTRAS
jgi:hypothetical protein